MSDKPTLEDWLNVLIVDSEKNICDDIKRYLKTHGVPDERIQAVENAEDALDILMENEALDARKRVHLLLCDVMLGGKSNGADLIEMVRHDIDNRPCIVSMTDFEQTEEIEESLMHHADLRLLKDNDFYEVGLEKAIQRTSEFIEAQADPRESKEEVAKIVSPEEIVSIYEQSLPDLTKSGYYPDGTLVSLKDGDGTLWDEFGMGRFATDLRDHQKYAPRFLKLLEKLPPTQRKRNKEALNRLYLVTQKSKKGEYIIDDQGETSKFYEEMIEYMNICYARAMAGLPVKEVCAIGLEWSREDVKRHLFKFVKPLIDMEKHMGIVPTLITGMPAEIVTGYREALGIEERCHFLELVTEKNEDDERVYVNAIKEQGGLSESKEEIARMIAKLHNILLVFGNQSSDLKMMNVGMDKKAEQEHAPYGKAFYVIDEKSSERQKHVKGIDDAVGFYFARRHLKTLDKGWTRFAILEEVAQQLFRVERWFQYVKEMEGVAQEFRDKLHELVYHPHGKPDGNGTPIEKRGGFKQFIPED